MNLKSNSLIDITFLLSLVLDSCILGVANSVNRRTGTLKLEGEARSIGSPKYKNLKLKKKRRREGGSRRLLNTGSIHVPG